MPYRLSLAKVTTRTWKFLWYLVIWESLKMLTSIWSRSLWGGEGIFYSGHDCADAIEALWRHDSILHDGYAQVISAHMCFNLSPDHLKTQNEELQLSFYQVPSLKSDQRTNQEKLWSDRPPGSSWHNPWSNVKSNCAQSTWMPWPAWAVEWRLSWHWG